MEARLPEVHVDPIGDMMLNLLIDRDAEEPYVDFKETIDIGKNAPFAKLAKDIFAFSNYGGGVMLIGFRQRSRLGATKEFEVEKEAFGPVGLTPEYQVDPASLQEKFNSYSNSPLELRYREFHRKVQDSQRRFAAIFIPPSTIVLRPVVNGIYLEKGKARIAFKVGQALTRRGTQSIVASDEEEDGIRKRAEMAGYQLSIFSGQPDRIQETLYGNMLEVVGLPETVWTAIPARPPESKPGFVFAAYEDGIVTLTDLSRTESAVLEWLEPGSVEPEPLSAWIQYKDKRLVIMQLLNNEVTALAQARGLVQEPEKMKFYYPCEGESRTETWTTRFGRLSTLTVAQRIWAQQLRKFVYWHVAVIARLATFGERMFLRLSPTIQLTEDGREAIFGPKEGTVITRLTYNRYNSSYLNSLLFWISRLADGKGTISLANGAVKVFTRPVETMADVGIIFDRPVSEPIQEAPEIQIEEAT